MEMLRIKGRSDKVIYYTQLCHFYIEDCSFNNACVNGIRVQVILFSYFLCFIFRFELNKASKTIIRGCEFSVGQVDPLTIPMENAPDVVTGTLTY